MEDELKELKNRVAKLEKLVDDLLRWQQERKRSQLTIPLDEQSQNIIKRYQTF